MKILKFVVLFFSLVGLLVFSSCENGGNIAPPKLTGVVVVNEGNFGQANGSISFYDEEKMNVINNVVKTANSGQEIGATIQSVTAYGSIGYVICNATDKIEILNLEDFKYLANPVTSISQPRQMIGTLDRGYITCWGPWGDNWDLPDSYVAVMDLTTNTIIDSLDCGSGPEGIIAIGKKVYVANSYETTITVFDLSAGTSSTIDVGASPQQFELDGNGTLWVSLTSFYGTYPAELVGLQSINLDTDTKETFVQIRDVTGKMALSGDAQVIFLLTAQPWPNTGTEVWAFNTNTNSLADRALISGDNFYALNVNPTTGKLYVADAAGFQGNGRIIVYDMQGNQLDEQIVGVGPNGFLFK